MEFILQPSERLLHQFSGSLCYMNQKIKGSIFITNERIFYKPGFFNKATPSQQISLNDIKHVYPDHSSSFGNNVVFIQSYNGIELRFSLKKKDELLVSIYKLIHK